MKKCYVVIVFSIMMLASSVFAAPLDILSVNGDEIIVEGAFGDEIQTGDRFAVRDYDGKDIAVIEVKELELFAGITKRNYICKIVSGDREINPGYTLYKYKEVMKRSIFFEYSSLSLDQEANASYETLSGQEARIKDKGMLLSLGVLAIGIKKDSPLGLYMATSYIDLGEIKTWSIIDFGGCYLPSLFKEKLTVGLAVGVGLGPTFGELNWHRPDGVYDDDIPENSGTAKIQARNIGMMFNYRLMTMATINLHRSVGIQFRFGYLGLGYGGYLDKGIPDDVESADGYDRWEVKDEWLETDIGKGSMTAGVSLLINFLDIM